METKKLNVTYSYMNVGTVTIDVSKNLNLEEAIEFAKKNKEKIPLPSNPEYVEDSSIIDEENCDFEYRFF